MVYARLLPVVVVSVLPVMPWTVWLAWADPVIIISQNCQGGIVYSGRRRREGVCHGRSQL